MQSERTSTVQKLTLLVLIGIFVCLAILIAQNSARKRAAEYARTTSEPEVTTIPSDENAVAPPAKPHAGNGTRRAPPARQSDASATEEYQYSESRNLTLIAPRPERIATMPPPPVPVARTIPPGRDAAMRLDRSRSAAVGRAPQSLHGTVTLRGVPPPERAIGWGISTPTCGAVNAGGATTRHYVVSPKGGLANVLVYIKSGLEHFTFPVSKEPVFIDSTACFFQPYVTVAQVGQKVRFRNLDPFLHNVHATPRRASEFNFAMVMAGQTNDWTFNTSELFIRIKCDVHEWMFTYLTVLDHPFAAITDADGTYIFPTGLPPGNYTVAAVHLKAGELTQYLTVGPSEVKSLDFTFQVPTQISGL